MAKATDRRAIELAKCAADVAYFTDTYGQIDDAQGHGDGSGIMPFKLWPEQARVLWQFLLCRLIIILKARQLGISWLCCSYALWLCLFHPGKAVLLFSKGQDEANELLRRITALYDRLPDWLRDALPARTKGNTEAIEWANGSWIKSLPASQNAGRSYTASLAILDEAAFLMWADKVFTGLKPTIDSGGQLIILSTANGLGNLFHRLWTRAVGKLNTFTTIFLPWWARPGRTRAWYEAQKGEYTDPNMVKQEYPASANEAFIASGRTRFDPEWIEAQSPNILEPLPSASLPVNLRSIRHLEVYSLPKPGCRYILSADVAEGLADGDFSAATLLDEETWEEVASYHAHVEPDEYADILKAIGDAYGARIVVERNNHGHAVLLALRKNGAQAIVHSKDGKPGWLTDKKTKPLSVDLLAAALRDNICKVRTQAALDEMQIYRILDNGGTGAPEGYHDDRVMSWAIALAILGTRFAGQSSAAGERPALEAVQQILGRTLPQNGNPLMRPGSPIGR